MIVYTEAIQKLYVAYFSRPADVAGLNFWQGVVSAANGSTADVSAAFAGSAEYKAAYANKTASQVVDTVYLNLFGRHAEKAGLDYWGPLLDNGSLTIDIVVTAVASGARGADLAAYNSKVSAATAFTAALDKPDEILGYAGATAIARAINFLAAVTDAGTLAAATAAANLSATVAAVTGAKLEPVAPAPSSIALTTAVDALSGTSGNDLFTATFSTLGFGDLINGAEGIDTLKIIDVATAPDVRTPINGDSVTLSSIEEVVVASSGGLKVDAIAWTGISSLLLITNGTSTVSTRVAGQTSVGVFGPHLSSADITGAGGVVLVDNVGPTSWSDTSGQGTSLTSVRLNGFGGVAEIRGASMRAIGLADVTRSSTVTVSNSTPGHSLYVELDNVGFPDAAARKAIDVTLIDALAGSVTIDALGQRSALTLSAASATKLSLIGTQWLYLDTNPAVSARLTTIDGSKASGDIRIGAIGPSVHTVTTGSGYDYLKLTTATARDNPATPGITETVTATVTTGEGQDTVFLATSGDGQVNVATGNGNDDVILQARGAGDVISVDLGAGVDTFWSSTAEVRAGDSIKGGEGNDILDLAAVNATNAAAFSGFEMYNAGELNKTVNVSGLMANNTGGLIYTFRSVGAAHIVGVAPGTEIGLYDDMEGSTLAVSLASAAAQIIRVDMDEADPADAAPETDTASVSLYNALYADVIFESDYRQPVAGELAFNDNMAILNLSTKATVEARVHSGGTYANNVLYYTDLTSTLRSLTVTGSQKLALNVVSSRLDYIDAAAHIGGLTVSTGSLADAGTLKLGLGADVVHVAPNSTSFGFETVANMERAGAAAIGANAAAAQAAIADADLLVFAGASVANATSVAGGTVGSRGVLTFTGAAPASLSAAFAIASLAAESSNELLVFSYLNDSYVFMQGATDIVVKLAGSIGIGGIAETGTDAFFIL